VKGEVSDGVLLFLLMGWPGRAQCLICWSAAGEALRKASRSGRRLAGLGHDVRLVPAQYVKPFLKGHKNDYRDAGAIAEAVQRPTMNFVAIKTPQQMDLLAPHRRARA
jgi:transposase